MFSHHQSDAKIPTQFFFSLVTLNWKQQLSRKVTPHMLPKEVFFSVLGTWLWLKAAATVCLLPESPDSSKESSYGWTPPRDSLQRLFSEFSARTRNLQACLGEDREKTDATSSKKLLIYEKSTLLRALEHPLDSSLSHWPQSSFPELRLRCFGRAALKSSHPLGPSAMCSTKGQRLFVQVTLVPGFPWEPPGAAAGPVPQPVPPCVSSL